MINVPIKGHSNRNYNIKLDVFLETEYIKIKKMSKRRISSLHIKNLYFMHRDK